MARSVRRSGGWFPDVHVWTSISAFAIGGLLIVEFLVQVAMGPKPPLDQVDKLAAFATAMATPTLVKILVDTLMMAFLIVFLGGFRALIVQARSDLHWVADLAFGAGLVFVGVTLVGDSMEAGGALDTIGSDPQGIAIRALTEGYMVMFGPMTCVLLALVSAAAGHVILASRALPAWTGRLAWVVAGLNLVGVVSLFGGTDSSHFFSVGGFGIATFATFPWLVWVVAVGIVTVRERGLDVVRDVDHAVI